MNGMRSLIVFLCVAVVAAAEGAPRRRAVGRPSLVDQRYVNAAMEVANWLDTLALERAGGRGWPLYDGAPGPTPGLVGTSGVGLFNLRLYQVTRDTRFLDTAKAAATFAFNQRPQLFEWQSGAAGVGEFMVALYRETREPVQLDRVRSIADRLLTQGIRDDDEMHWEGAPGHTSIAHGSAGAAIFLIHAYDETGDARYLEAAEAAMRWMKTHTVIAGDGILWKRLTTDTDGSTSWCGGSTGAIELLTLLARLTGKSEYTQLIASTARGLASSVHRVSPGGVTWPYSGNTPADERGGQPYVYCHGTSSTMIAMEQAAKLTGSGEFASIAAEAAEHLTAARELKLGGASWRHIRGTTTEQPGFMIGVASVGHGFIERWRLHRDPRDLAVALEAANYLLGMADRPKPGQMRFINITDGPAEWIADAGYGVGWWDGASGIGIYLLEVHDALRGIVPPPDVTPINP